MMLLRPTVVFILLELSCYVRCDTEVAQGEKVEDSFHGAWVVKGNTLKVKILKKNNRFPVFYYLTHDPSTNYAIIYEAHTDPYKLPKLYACKRFFKSSKGGNVEIYEITVDDEPHKSDTIDIKWSTSTYTNGYYISTIKFSDCYRANRVEKSESIADSPTLLNDTAVDVTNEYNNTSFASPRKDEPVGNATIRMLSFWSHPHEYKEVTLTPAGECPNGKCDKYSVTKTTKNGQKSVILKVDNLNLHCTNHKDELHSSVTEDPDGKLVCFHFVCSDDYYKKSSTDKMGQVIQYRRDCIPKSDV